MKKFKLTAVCAVTTALCAPTIAHAQLANSSPAGGSAQTGSEGIQEIVVTARRQEENLQRTPVAVTALGTTALKQAQITSVADLQRTAPGLSIATGAPGGTSGFAFVQIRGQGNLSPGLATDPAVGIYIDGVYIPRPSQAQFELVDIARVEVLRGPQGTLFGRNTTGGALNFLTADPDSSLSAQLRGGIGNFDYREGSIMLNAPLGSDLAVRVVYDHKEHGGYAFNALKGLPLDDLDANIVRAKLKWTPGGGDWSVMLAGDYSRQTDHGVFDALTAVNPFGPVAFQAAMLAPYLHSQSNFYTDYAGGYEPGSGSVAGEPQSDRTVASGGSMTINGKLGSFGVKSITAYRYSNSIGVMDIDGTPSSILTVDDGYLSKAFSQEVQFSGDITEHLSFITGGYYSRETGSQYSKFQPFGFFGLPVSLNNADVRNISAGVFGQFYYKLTDRLRLSGGLRWTFDERNVYQHNLTVLDQPSNALVGSPPSINCTVTPDDGNPADCTESQSVKFNYPAYTAGFDYQASESLFLYAKTSRASKAGGFNLGAGAVPAFRPETVTDIELGAKADLFDRHLRLNLAVFHEWQSQVQRDVKVLIQGPPLTSVQYLVNAGKIHLSGIEAEATVIPWHGMEVHASGTYIGGGYDRGSYLESQVINGSPVVVDRSGEPLLQVPPFQASIGATQTVPLSAGKLSLHADYAYISAQHFYAGTLGVGSSADAVTAQATANQLGRTPGYGLLNGRIAFTLDKPDIEFAFFVKNLTAKKYLTRRQADFYTGLGIATDFVGQPRTYGLTVTINFGQSKAR